MSEKLSPDVVLSQNLMSAQIGVLGSMMLDEDCVGAVLSRVSAEDFVQREYRSIFEAIQGLFRSGLPTDAIGVRERLGGGTGGSWSQLLKDILDLTPTAANAEGYAQLLKESSMLHRLRELGDELRNAEVLADAKEILDKAMQLQVGRPGVHAVTFAEAYEQFFDRHGDGNHVEFLEWAIPQLNEVLQVELGNIVIFGAYPGDGKTAFAMQCAAKFGKKHRVGYFSFESTSARLYDRQVAAGALIDADKINGNKLTEEDWGELIALRDTLAKPDVTLIDASGMTAMDVVAYSQARHFDVIVVDYLQQVEAPKGPYMKDFERVTEVSRELQKFAVRTGTTVVALSQLSRPDKIRIQYKDEDGEKHVKNVTPPPTMGDLRSSGQIEQDADVILLMWREDYDVKDSPRVIQVAKNRNGEALDRVRCKFDGQHQTFSRMEPRREYTRKERQQPRQESFWKDSAEWFEEKKPDPDNPFMQGGEAK